MAPTSPPRSEHPPHRSPLRFLLLWPLYQAFIDWARQRLRRHLAVSHLGTVFISVVVTATVGALALAILAYVQSPLQQEPANDASHVATMLEALHLSDNLTSAQAADLLQLAATGKIAPNNDGGDVQISATIGRSFVRIRTISLVDPNGRIVASNDPTLIGRPASAINAAAADVAQRAVAGTTDLARNSVVGHGGGAITGAYPITGSGGQVVGAVVVDKWGRGLPEGPRIFLVVLAFVAEIALLLLVLVGLPAIPVGLIIGIRRARAIGRPITGLAAAAQRIASGDLHARVGVRGQDEIADLGRSFNQMADKLQAALAQEAAQRAKAEALLAANRALVASVSHELRTPVSLVRGHLEALASEPTHREEYTRIALRETDRLESLVNDLFELSRLETRAVAVAREPFDAGSAVREAVESLAEPARREAGITMRADVSAGDLRCLGDRARLIQVVQNLIRNALRFTPEGGIVLVGAQAAGDAVAVTVRDTGVGIPPEQLPHIFERFYRGEQSRNRAGGGAGLGLAIARQLVEGMGGTIAVESGVGEGSTFTITLPRADAPAGAANGRAAR